MMKVLGVLTALQVAVWATPAPVFGDDTTVFPRQQQNGGGTPPPSSCAPKFSWENTILTEASLDKQTADLFGFGKGKLPKKGECKAFPGDASWPSQQTWNKFNATAGGALIKTVPLAAPCHNDWPQVYDNATCQAITQNWSDPHLHIEDPSSTMWPIFQGRTCLPSNDPNAPCTLGGYAAYSVAIKTVKQIQLAINFARLANLRLVVKNTGHDFADKSIGAGALSIWTHKLNDIQFFPSYSCGSGPASFSGPAFKLGAGVVTEEIYAAAEAHGVSVVGGECHTVGIAGGYIAGGGHSPLSSLAGMGADQVLSLEVVLPSGEYVTASADSNPDLYWALRGGGGSTFGVVTSVVIRAYPKIPVTTMTFNFVTSPNVTADIFWAGMRSFFSHFDRFTSAGAYAYWLVVPIAAPPANEFFFQFMPFWANNMTVSQTQALVAPFLAELTALGIPYSTPIFTHFPSYFQAYNGTFPPLEQVGAPTGHSGSRLFPRENFSNGAKLNTTLSAVRYALTNGGVLIGYAIRSAPPQDAISLKLQDNAINPAWRKNLGFFILGGPQTAPDATDATISNNARILTTDWMKRWREASPGAGSYMSEGDINEPNFQQSFYGEENYKRLLKLKKKLDPSDVFWAITAVGSEDWKVQGQLDFYPTQNGRLCRVS
ncbi:FAD-binding domain-containing protein [Rhypophila decipiens]|uniref:FAD-binding domain-containing protein n=1 Tax=Rhypophila decipiens TaxID=261697 RepID=A0AAN6YHE3_9PEZI|nr:FAD-binding domain-containing protein [Rhypophila decipiens]